MSNAVLIRDKRLCNEPAVVELFAQHGCRSNCLYSMIDFMDSCSSATRAVLRSSLLSITCDC